MEASPVSTSRSIWAYHYSRGAIEFEKGNYEQSLQWLLKMDDPSNDLRSDPGFYQQRDLLARVYLETGRIENAIAEYETLLSATHWAALPFAVQLTQARYYLGRAYEEAGRTQDAADMYQRFLDRWGEADVRLEIVEDARTRMARLKS